MLARLLPVSLVITSVVSFSSVARADSHGVTLEPDWPLTIVDGRAILIDSPQGIHPSPRSLVEVVISPAPNVVPLVTWHTTNEVVVRPEPGGYAFGGYSPPGASIDRSGRVGAFTISAAVGDPIGRTASISGFAYESIALGCDESYGGGYRIDAAGVPHETTTIAMSDISWQAPVEPGFEAWNRCSSEFQPPIPVAATLNVPGGAILLEDENRFTVVDGSRWKGRIFYHFDPKALRGTLLWRTRDGRLMKTYQLIKGSADVIGPTIMADASGRFADNP